MKQSTKDKIKESIKDLEAIGGLKNPKMMGVIVKLKKALQDEESAKKTD
jgi:hypothetical protein